MRKRTTAVVLFVTIALVGACGKASTESGGSPGSGVTGNVTVSGSSTVEPISSLVAETFASNNPDASISVDGPGTSDGFVSFCKGETDINDASRQIEPTEAAACKAGGVHYVELEIAQDGITVMTNPANASVSCLTLGDLYALFGPESSGFRNWSDANALAQEVGGNGGFPDAPLVITAPGEESGTYGSFIDLAMKTIAGERKQPDDQLRTGYQASADDNQIISGVEGSDSGLGFVGFSYAQGAGDQVKELQIDGGDGCVTPTAETIADGTYPLSRSLYLYVNTDTAATNPALKAFVDSYLSDEGLQAVTDVGYVALPDARIAATKAMWGKTAA